VLLLRDVFDYSYEEIAKIVGKSEDNTRQLAARARRHVDEGKPRFETSREQRDELAKRFLAAAQGDDLAALEALLADDVALHGDGGGKVPALARAMFGRDRVARTISAWSRNLRRIPGASIRQVEVNGQAGALIYDGEERLFAVWVIDIADGQIQGVNSIVNPDKLRSLGELADFKDLVRQFRESQQRTEADER
jgi:RNA polymerase sigma-70 factor (ECF subfamily)